MLKKAELLVLIILIVGLVMINNRIGKLVASDNIKTPEKVIVLDAGHGGNDPGKVGVNGVLEKDLNLQITMRVRDILEEKGISVVMTREMDEMLCDTDTNNKKMEDMKARVDVINKNKPFLAVSIHQNSYTDPTVKGAQVFFYSESEEGEQMAAILQNALLKADTNNHRKAKANDSYYLLKRTCVPTVIVECGFLSNKEEAEKLATKDYQETISNAIVEGIESCFRN